MATKLGTIVADFSTTLATGLAIGGTSAILQSATDDDGNALPSGRYFFAIDGDNSQKEHVSCTLSGTSLTSICSLSRQGIETSGCVRPHRVGATITLTDWAHLKFINDLAGGATALDSTAPLGYDGTASLTTPNQLATKAYADSIAIAGGVDASSTLKGVAKLSIDPVSSTSPIAVGDNDARVPTQDENDALVGTSGTAVSSSNKLVDNDDTGTSGANKVLRLDGSGNLPALNGSNLTGVTNIANLVTSVTGGMSGNAGSPVCWLPYPASQVTLDSKTCGTNNATTTTVSFTVGSNSNRALVVFIGVGSSTGLSAVTYGGVSMSQIDVSGTNQYSNPGTLYSYYLMAPASGTNNLVITGSGTIPVEYHVFSYYNCAQTTTPDAHLYAGLGSISGSFSFSLLPVSNGGLVVGASNEKNTVGGSILTNNTQTANNMISGASNTSYPPSAQTFTNTASTFVAAAAIALAPYIASGATPRAYLTSTAQTSQCATYIGILQSAMTAGTSCTVATGGIDSNQSGLTIGNQYYLKDALGTIGTSPGTVTRKAAISVDTTHLLITNVW